MYLYLPFEFPPCPENELASAPLAREIEFASESPLPRDIALPIATPVPWASAFDFEPPAPYVSDRERASPLVVDNELAVAEDPFMAVDLAPRPILSTALARACPSVEAALAVMSPLPVKWAGRKITGVGLSSGLSSGRFGDLTIPRPMASGRFLLFWTPFSWKNEECGGDGEL